MKKLSNVLTNLSETQSALIKPALSVIQLGAGFYLVDVIKPYILPLMLVSLGTIGIVLFQATLETGCQ
jgi:hypothetical protein